MLFIHWDAKNVQFRITFLIVTLFTSNCKCCISNFSDSTEEEKKKTLLGGICQVVFGCTCQLLVHALLAKLALDHLMVLFFFSSFTTPHTACTINSFAFCPKKIRVNRQQKSLSSCFATIKNAFFWQGLEKFLLKKCQNWIFSYSCKLKANIWFLYSIINQ